LGDTLALIATEKAGIIKPGVPVVSAPQEDEALAVIQERCQELAAPLTLVGQDWTWFAGETGIEGQRFELTRGGGVPTSYSIPLLGEHQIENAAVAVATLSVLASQGIDIPPDALQAGLRTVNWPGRMEVLRTEPWLVVDSAHNGDSAEKLVEALQRHCAYERLIVVVGASSDHVTSELLTTLMEDAGVAIATRARHPKAASPAWLRQRAGDLGLDMEITESVPEALERALEIADPQDLVCCTGSVFVAAEARAAWFLREGLTLPPADPF
jgi:dihydrofolate synthase/folylpolyglutamate synthase